MRVAFRVDSAHHIGNGHLMRCLTLADAAVARGAEVLFLSRELPGTLSNLVSEKGYPLRSLTGAISLAVDRDDPQTWLGWSQADDAQASKAILAREGPLDALVIDSYAIDAQWHAQLQPYCRCMVVIDDLANRPYQCDLLLDQTFGRLPNAYQTTVSSDSRLLLGTDYALLREQFVRERPGALVRRLDGHSRRRLLVAVGGVDADNLAGRLLEWLEPLSFSSVLDIDIILAANAPYLGNVKRQAEGSRHFVRVLVNVEEMASLMSRADIAIGAAGSSSWERCCLGLPTILLITADNQRVVARNLSAVDAVINLGSASSCQASQLRGAVACLLDDDERYSSLVQRAQAICDGEGVLRVMDAIHDLLKEPRQKIKSRNMTDG